MGDSRKDDVQFRGCEYGDHVTYVTYALNTNGRDREMMEALARDGAHILNKQDFGSIGVTDG